MNLADIKSVYFVGAGGIGMSALVRYFLSIGKFVAGYDRTPSELTEQLIAEGAAIHYEENIDLIPPMCLDQRLLWLFSLLLFPTSMLSCVF
jgi:UDP-N-acetylmuramate--alanine ligase